MSVGSPRLLLIDNYDSFSWNLVQYLGALGAAVEVVANDAVSVDAVLQHDADGLILSPGPGRPEAAGICVELVRRAAGRVPILGVCLGHQAIGVAYGARVRPAARVMHGKSSSLHHDGLGVLAGIPASCPVMRYHSLAIDPATLPAELPVTAWSDDGEVMAVRHRTLPVEGVQFHPESIGTPDGMAMLDRFVSDVRARAHRSAA